MTDAPAFALSSVGLWTGALDMVPAARACDLAVELEELGYGALWLPEVAGRDPFVHLAMLLSATQRIVGATGIASIWARDAVTTSCAANALTEAFPDRVLIGLGVSHQNLVGGLRGHHYDKPLTAMRRYLDGIDRAPYTHTDRQRLSGTCSARSGHGCSASRGSGQRVLTPTSSAPSTPLGPGTFSVMVRCCVRSRL